MCILPHLVKCHDHMCINCIPILCNTQGFIRKMGKGGEIILMKNMGGKGSARDSAPARGGLEN